MIRIFSFIVLSFFTIPSLFSQELKSFEIQGQVIDSLKNPIEAAVVFVLDSKDNNTIGQYITNKKGFFSAEATVPTCILMISSLGHELYTSPVIVRKSKVVLPPIILYEETFKLDTVVLVGEKKRPIIEHTAGKLVYNVANSINAQGTNALEVLKKAPGITVINDNSINIAGRQGTLILLNGKQTYIQATEIADLLKSIPSSSIKSIETISNPSSQYDAAGSGGIINIVLKKDKKEGLNLILTNGIAYGYSLKQNTEFSFNYRKNRFNLYGNYGHNIGNFAYRYGSDRELSNQKYTSWSVDSDKRNTIGTSLGMDYELDNTQTIGIQASGNFLFGPGIIHTDTEIRDLASNELLQTLLSVSDYYSQKSNRMNLNMNYSYKDSLDRELTIDLDYGNFDGKQKNLQPNSYYAPDGNLLSTNSFRTLNGRDMDLYAFSANYTLPFLKGKMVTGIKYSNVATKNTYDLFSVGDTEELIDDAVSNTFDFQEKIASAYFQFDLPIHNDVSFQIGTRLENTTSKGTLRPKPSSGLDKTEISRNYLNVFPSFGITYKIEEEQTIALNYGKRIDRPAYQDLNPIEQPLDGLSYWKGNPFLSPQITHRIATQYSTKKSVIGLSYSHTDAYAAQITDRRGSNEVVMQPRNLGVQQQLALNMVQQFNFFKAWNISLNITTYYLRNNIALDELRRFDESRIAASFNVQQTIKMPLNIMGEISFVYNTDRLGGANDFLKENSQLDFGIKRNFLNDRATVRLVLTDIYRGSNWDGESRFDGFYQRSYGFVESRQLKFNFTYNFGNIKVKKPAQRESGLKSENGRL